MSSTTPIPVERRTVSRPSLAIGLTFLLLGLGFSFPVPLAPVPPKHMWDGSISAETLNLYALTVFAGWSHFVYAWRGQWISSRRWSRTSRIGYWVTIAGILATFVALRAWTGVAAFSLLAWVYNIAHFVKAEVYFSGTRKTSTAFYSPVGAFAWFTACLFQLGPLKNIHVVFAGSLLIAALVLIAGGWKLLSAGEIRLPILTLFLLGETLVWASYSPYMSNSFRVGIYVFHIAAASFYHYLTAYFYAESKNMKRSDPMLTPMSILWINIVVVGLGVSVAWLHELRWLRPFLGLDWFTLWVALHLAASDLQPYWKKHLITAP